MAADHNLSGAVSEDFNPFRLDHVLPFRAPEIGGLRLLRATEKVLGLDYMARKAF